MVVEGLILAAGFSSRAGGFKMELPLGDRTVLEWCIAGLAPVCDRLIVVGGYRIEKVRAIVDRYPQIELVENSGYAAGMFSSVKLGAARIRGERFLLTPGDYPLLKPEVCRQLLTVDAPIAIPTFGGRKGHPVAMAGVLARELAAEPDDSNLRNFIGRQGFTPVAVADDGILLDVDTPEDYRQLLERVRQGGADHG